jgi:hypothetical protein
MLPLFSALKRKRYEVMAGFVHTKKGDCMKILIFPIFSPLKKERLVSELSTLDATKKAALI